MLDYTYLNMTYYYHCNICDKTVLLKSANRHIQSKWHKYLALTFKYEEVYYDVDIEEVDYLYKKFVRNHNKKFEKYTIQCHFNMHFSNNCLPGIVSKLFTNDTVCDWKGFLNNVISDFNDKGYVYSHTSKMFIITHNHRKDLTYSFYMSLPMCAVERRINILLHKNPDLINSFDRTIDHPLIRKFSYVPN